MCTRYVPLFGSPSCTIFAIKSYVVFLCLALISGVKNSPKSTFLKTVNVNNNVGFKICHLLNREVNNGRIFLNEKSVFGKTLYVQDEVRRELGDFESFHKILFVSFVFLFILSVEFC